VSTRPFPLWTPETVQVRAVVDDVTSTQAAMWAVRSGLVPSG